MKFYRTFPKALLSLLASFVLFAAFTPTISTAQNHHFHHGDFDAEIEPRLDPRDADFAMTTREGSVDMLVDGDFILIQFSDQFLAEVEDEIEDEEDFEEASVFADLLKSMITSGVKSLLDHSLVIPVYEISEVYYEDGRLYLIDHEGDELFEDLEIDDTDVMEDFSRRDARRFVAAVEKRMI